MTLSAIEKAEKDREAQKTMLQYLGDEVKLHGTTPFTEAHVQTYIVQIDALWIELLQTHRRIIGSVAADVNTSDYEAEHKSMMSEASKIKIVLVGINAQLTKTSTAGPTGGQSSNSSTDVRLPRMEIPKFTGDRNEWIPFRDMFLAAIHQNISLSDVQKLSYLQSSVTGDAARLIQTIALTESNYKIAWERLKTRFENKRSLVYSILKKFTSQKGINESAEALLSLIDTSTACVQSLSSFEVPVEHWDAILGFLILDKVDEETRKAWELTRTDDEIPNWKEIIQFLEQRAQALVASGVSKQQSSKYSAWGGKKAQVHYAASSRNCKNCGGDHHLFRCKGFEALSVPERKLFVKQNLICFNCLGEGHRVRECRAKGCCRACREKHHSLLHEVPRQGSSLERAAESMNHHIRKQLRSQTLFATAIVRVFDSWGDQQLCRIALDNFSSDCIIESSCVQRLGLRRNHDTTIIRGLGGACLGTAQGTTEFTLTPNIKGMDEKRTTVEALIVHKLVSQLPSFHLDSRKWGHLDDLQLADPKFYKPGHIDILVGGDIFWEFILGEKKMGPSGTPMAVNSTLGWLVVGKVDVPGSYATVHHVQSLEKTVEKFWELDSVPTTKVLTEDEEKCEEHFRTTYSRSLEGRFGVDLPFRAMPPQIGASREIAIRRLKALEKRLEARPEVKKQYHEFLRIYLEMGHMKRLDENVKIPEPHCYIPHHFIQKDPSTFNKFRVVFDASAKTANHKSLNDTLMVGPTIQDSHHSAYEISDS